MTRPPWTLGRVPVAPFMEARTAVPPGVTPLAADAWLHTDETYAAQMTMRDGLIAEQPEEVYGTRPGGEAAAILLM